MQDTRNLVAESGLEGDTLVVLKSVVEKKISINSKWELINALVAERAVLRSHAAHGHENLVSFLSSQQCTLFGADPYLKIDVSHLSEILIACGGLDGALHQLQAFNSNGSNFEDAQDLVEGVQRAMKDRSARIDTIFKYLCTDEATNIIIKDTDGEKWKPSQLELTSDTTAVTGIWSYEDASRLYEAEQNLVIISRSVIDLLQLFVKQGRRFGKTKYGHENIVNQVISAIEAVQSKELETKRRHRESLLSYISKCNLFVGASQDTSETFDMSVTTDDLDELLEAAKSNEGGLGDETHAGDDVSEARGAAAVQVAIKKLKYFDMNTRACQPKYAQAKRIDVHTQEHVHSSAHLQIPCTYTTGFLRSKANITAVSRILFMP